MVLVASTVGVAVMEADPEDSAWVGWGAKTSNVVVLPSLMVPSTRPTEGTLRAEDVVASSGTQLVSGDFGSYRRKLTLSLGCQWATRHAKQGV